MTGLVNKAADTRGKLRVGTTNCWTKRKAESTEGDWQCLCFLTQVSTKIVTISLVGLLGAWCFTRFSGYECKSGFAELFVISILHQVLQDLRIKEGCRTIYRNELWCGSKSGGSNLQLVELVEEGQSGWRLDLFCSTIYLCRYLIKKGYFSFIVNLFHLYF